MEYAPYFDPFTSPPPRMFGLVRVDLDMNRADLDRRFLTTSFYRWRKSSEVVNALAFHSSGEPDRGRHRYQVPLLVMEEKAETRDNDHNDLRCPRYGKQNMDILSWVSCLRYHV